MNVQPVTTSHFDYDGRGPTLLRWIHDHELVLPGTGAGRSSLPGGVVGAEHSMGWVVFRGLQVFQEIPEEVHSYLYYESVPEGTRHSGAYEVSDSAWKSSFSQQHLADHRHFILVFYDQLVEVLCRELVFGAGAFRIAEHPELSYYGLLR